MLPPAPPGGAVDGAGSGAKLPQRADSAVDIPGVCDGASGAGAARAGCLQRPCGATPRRRQRRRAEEEGLEGPSRAARAAKACVLLALLGALVTTALVFDAGACVCPLSRACGGALVCGAAGVTQHADRARMRVCCVVVWCGDLRAVLRLFSAQGGRARLRRALRRRRVAHGGGAGRRRDGAGAARAGAVQLALGRVAMQFGVFAWPRADAATCARRAR
jgi:hypothetical protein